MDRSDAETSAASERSLALKGGGSGQTLVVKAPEHGSLLHALAL